MIKNIAAIFPTKNTHTKMKYIKPASSQLNPILIIVIIAHLKCNSLYSSQQIIIIFSPGKTKEKQKWA